MVNVMCYVFCCWLSSPLSLLQEHEKVGAIAGNSSVPGSQFSAILLVRSNWTHYEKNSDNNLLVIWIIKKCRFVFLLQTILFGFILFFFLFSYWSAGLYAFLVRYLFRVLLQHICRQKNHYFCFDMNRIDSVLIGDYEAISFPIQIAGKCCARIKPIHLEKKKYRIFKSSIKFSFLLWTIRLIEINNSTHFKRKTGEF